MSVLNWRILEALTRARDKKLLGTSSNNRPILFRSKNKLTKHQNQWIFIYFEFYLRLQHYKISNNIKNYNKKNPFHVYTFRNTIKKSYRWKTGSDCRCAYYISRKFVITIDILKFLYLIVKNWFSITINKEILK